MSNPVFNSSPVFGDPNAQQQRGRAGTAQQGGARGQVPGYGTPGGQSAYGTPGAYGAGPATTDAAQLNAMYDAPSATTAQTKRLTYDDVIIKTGGLLALLVVVAAATWVLAPGLYILGAIAGLVLGLVNAFKREPSPLLITLYTIAQGMFLGGISAFYEAFYSGVVPTAVVATVCTFTASLLLFRSGKVRVTPKFTKILLIGLVGYLLFSIVNVFVLIFAPGMGEWGLRGGAIGIGVSLIAVVLAAMSLIMDFDSIKRGVEHGVPAKYAWSAAFGLMVTLIWLYTEFLRLFAILQGRD
ncbi:Bax inhibitor-1/YccA family protein [Cellulomonas sp. PhB143]|uniref:Bax inhibitor-1/YccA family protein n=1 Tax=Cellulomonas sp. PhB143 TaxID=2485186 RepID=UPI000F497EB2|nr:Bax inhibitor-1/YccA family protein [Cellulomonas sp. PhB143]ROS78639.1 putative YccA/Bax inhibitor family protein [Cellulomonas sp. PhB143]